ncbi:MAG: protein kinase [Myxococcales bacterium]|nr:protein kinase [Myxococcales bacterium]
MHRPVPFGKYILLERISVGGMAEVFKAKAFGVEGFARCVAIKRILPHLAEDPRFVEMFINEARVAVQLNHANIAQVYELGRHENDHYIAMEYISGKDLLSLHQYARRTGDRLPVPLAVYVAAKVSEGLGYAHRKTGPDGQPLGIIHRDISPQNVLLSYEGAIKLIDFGIAKARIHSHQTQAGVLKGKFGYMSPEQITGKAVDQRSDIFALGTVVHEMLTGERLFFGDNDFLTLEKVRAAQVEPPSRYNPDVPPVLDEIILRALARDPGARYQSASQLADDLARYLHTSGNGVSSKAMTEWMRSRFIKDIAEEEAKDEHFARLILSAEGELYEEAQSEEDATALWDPMTEMNAGEDDSAPPPHMPADNPSLTAPTPLMMSQEMPSLTTPSPVPSAMMPKATPRPAGLAAAMAQVMPADGDATTRDALTPPPQTAQMLPPGRRGARRDLIIALCVLGLAGVLGIGAYHLLTAEPAGPAPSMIVNVQPTDALQISFDGTYVRNESPLVVQSTTPGAHALKITRDGYKDYEQTVELVAGERKELDIELQRADTSPGRLIVTVKPTDAKVQIDDKDMSPEQLAAGVELPSGQPLLLRATRADYRPSNQTVVLEAGESRQLSLIMQPTDGTLMIDSEPIGNVYINDRMVGRTPFNNSKIDLSGPVKVRVVTEGYKAFEQTVDFGDTRFQHLEIKLEKGP